MLDLSPEDQVALKQSLKQTARILKKYTEPEKLKDFESIEVELRNQMLTIVSPALADFFLTQNHKRLDPHASSTVSLDTSKSATNKPEL